YKVNFSIVVLQIGFAPNHSIINLAMIIIADLMANFNGFLVLFFTLILPKKPPKIMKNFIPCKPPIFE
ncbi:MAG: hypothetical protein ACI4DY_14525, partial [Monoglobaceae bacterium]